MGKLLTLNELNIVTSGMSELLVGSGTTRKVSGAKAGSRLSRVDDREATCEEPGEREMKRPVFTKEELFIINYYLAKESRLQDNVISSQLGYVTPSCIVFALGIYSENPLLSVIGFLLILFFLIWNSWRGLRWERVYRGILLKYESVFDSPNDASTSASPVG